MMITVHPKGPSQTTCLSVPRLFVHALPRSGYFSWAAAMMHANSLLTDEQLTTACWRQGHGSHKPETFLLDSKNNGL